MRGNDSLAVISGARTALAKAFTDLRHVSAVELGRVALEDALRRSSLRHDEVDEVVFGNVSGPPDAANIARVIALRAGIPQDRIAHTVNRNCASGMEAIISGWQSIRDKRARFVIAGGTESMSNIPLLFNPEATALWLRLGRAKTLRQRLRVLTAFRPRHFSPVAGIELGLTDPISGLNMGETAEVLAKEFGISRHQQDQFAMESHRKAETAQTECFLSGEIVRTETGQDTWFERDNGIRFGQSMEQLSKLKPIFASYGTVTAGHSCPLTDGAAALVLCSPEHVDHFSAPPLGYITATAIAGCDPRRMGLGPVFAIARLLEQTGMSINDFDLFEINEAFAAQVIACQEALQSDRFAEQELGRSRSIGAIPPDRLNVHGGAIALGHPVGATGARLVITLLRSLRASGKRKGLATLCVGGGQGVAMVVETELEKNR